LKRSVEFYFTKQPIKVLDIHEIIMDVFIIHSSTLGVGYKVVPKGLKLMASHLARIFVMA
jgi:hypothetical protein